MSITRSESGNYSTIFHPSYRFSCGSTIAAGETITIIISRPVDSAKLELVLIRMLLRLELDSSNIVSIRSEYRTKISASAIMSRLFILLEYCFILGNSHIIFQVVNMNLNPKMIRDDYHVTASGLTKMLKETKSKVIRNRVASVTPATRDARKSEVQKKIRETTTNIENYRNMVAEKTLKLKELAKTPLDSSRPGEKAEYDYLVVEVTKIDRDLIE
ncbi:uncharacterized protein RAG0_14531 [Rhynchosporium agropyri]|uniref:Uncharacterized protein n=1 Tax=Rhynchosporium agropyri TaxID=914238 RepID=A0A1E1LHC7_9HELO|nr:uncharacterized protein RAG0_14531 [Rhynchosporium agropyri]